MALKLSLSQISSIGYVSTHFHFYLIFFFIRILVFIHVWKLMKVDPRERSTWRSGVRSAMCAASQLPGKGPTDVDYAPAPAR